MGGEPPAELPPGEQVLLCVGDERIEVDVWRSADGMQWVGRGRIGSTDLILSGSEVAAGTLRLKMADDLGQFTAFH